MFAVSVYGQNSPINLNKKDTVTYKQPYGIRVGIDLSRPLISFLEDNYTGLEFVGDYRLTQDLYLAGELGNEKKSIGGLFFVRRHKICTVLSISS